MLDMLWCLRMSKVAGYLWLTGAISRAQRTGEHLYHSANIGSIILLCSHAAGTRQCIVRSLPGEEADTAAKPGASMAKISDSRGRSDEDSGYTRLLGNAKL